LVAGDERLFSRRQVPLDNVKIRAADAAGSNPKQDLTGGKLRLGSLFDMKRLRGISVGFECGSFQFENAEAIFDLN
jgi:hypothetical protein